MANPPPPPPSPSPSPLLPGPASALYRSQQKRDWATAAQAAGLSSPETAQGSKLNVERQQFLQQQTGAVLHGSITESWQAYAKSRQATAYRLMLMRELILFLSLHGVSFTYGIFK